MRGPPFGEVEVRRRVRRHEAADVAVNPEPPLQIELRRRRVRRGGPHLQPAGGRGGGVGAADGPVLHLRQQPRDTPAWRAAGADGLGRVAGQGQFPPHDPGRVRPVRVQSPHQPPPPVRGDGPVRHRQVLAGGGRAAGQGEHPHPLAGGEQGPRPSGEGGLDVGAVIVVVQNRHPNPQVPHDRVPRPVSDRTEVRGPPEVAPLRPADQLAEELQLGPPHVPPRLPQGGRGEGRLRQQASFDDPLPGREPRADGVPPGPRGARRPGGRERQQGRRRRGGGHVGGLRSAGGRASTATRQRTGHFIPPRTVGKNRVAARSIRPPGPPANRPVRHRRALRRRLHLGQHAGGRLVVVRQAQLPQPGFHRPTPAVPAEH